MTDTKVTSFRLVSTDRVCVCACVCMRPRDCRESFLFTLAILIILINTDSFPNEATGAGSDLAGSSISNAQCLQFPPCLMTETLARGRACSLIYLFLLNIRYSGEAGELSSPYATYLLMPETLAHVCVRTWANVAWDVHTLPTHCWGLGVRSPVRLSEEMARLFLSVCLL